MITTSASQRRGPQGWKERTDLATGLKYFAYQGTKQTTFVDPRGLPQGWEQRMTEDGPQRGVTLSDNYILSRFSVHVLQTHPFLACIHALAIDYRVVGVACEQQSRGRELVYEYCERSRHRAGSAQVNVA